jgi:hypothetical protein
MARTWRVETVTGTPYLLVAAPPAKGSLPAIFSAAVENFGAVITGIPETVEDPEFGQALRYPAQLEPGHPTRHHQQGHSRSK